MRQNFDSTERIRTHQGRLPKVRYFALPPSRERHLLVSAPAANDFVTVEASGQQEDHHLWDPMSLQPNRVLLLGLSANDSSELQT